MSLRTSCANGHGRFKAADVDGLSALYEDDTAHHPVLTDPLHGLESTATLFRTGFARATMVCEAEPILEDGGWAVPE